MGGWGGTGGRGWLVVCTRAKPGVRGCKKVLLTNSCQTGCAGV